MSVYDLVRHQAGARGDGIAIAALNRQPLTYERLLRHLERIGGHLGGLGVGRNDRVGIVLPNGPEMATAFLAVASVATAAPLNPTYRAPEFDFYLSDLDAKALIVAHGMDSPAVAVAESRKIPVVRLHIDPSAEAGVFTLSPDAGTAKASIDWAQDGDVALVLHTSGTTSRPKIVPLTHANICASSRNISQWLALSPDDRCLNIMPLFHIHGLIAALLSSLAAGGSVFCSNGFVATQFWETLRTVRPTWYTAVPTMHQAILARAEADRSWLAGAPLRFVRSSSAALPPQVAEALEKVFGAPVIEAYGMTEAAHQMCSNPLPPQSRRFGSVGLAAGPEVAVMNQAGDLAAPGQSGEVVIRGGNVTPGYDKNPEANKSAFTRGWFRTGDLGYLDADGYLYLSGRAKEMINRGGEKISPLEVDNVLLDHPAVASALTFAMPDQRLGEAVAAAVVLRPASAISESELAAFVATRLADFKVPQRIVIVDEIPKGPTGKPQRIGLAKKLGLDRPQGAPPAAWAEPATTGEIALARIWNEVLKLDRVGRNDHFFHLGGDSILAAQVIARIYQASGKALPMLAFFGSPTLEAMAAALDAIPSPSQPAAAAETLQFERILQRVEALSDQEAEDLLKQELGLAEDHVSGP